MILLHIETDGRSLRKILDAVGKGEVSLVVENRGMIEVWKINKKLKKWRCDNMIYFFNCSASVYTSFMLQFEQGVNSDSIMGSTFYYELQFLPRVLSSVINTTGTISALIYEPPRTIPHLFLKCCSKSKIIFPLFSTLQTLSTFSSYIISLSWLRCVGMVGVFSYAPIGA